MFGNIGLILLTEQDLQHVESAVGLLLLGIFLGIILSLLLNKFLDE